MEFVEVEWVVLAWVLGDDDVDLDRCDAEDESGGCGEEAEETASCCIAAGEDTVEGREVLVETEDDEDCTERYMVSRIFKREAMNISTYSHSIAR